MRTPTQADPGRADEARTWGRFLLLSAIWGSSFLFIRIGLDEGVPPLTIVSYRTLFATLLLGAVLLVRGGRLPLRMDLWQRMLILGLTNIVVPFALIAWGQQYVPTGMAAVLNAMVPLFTMIVAAYVLRDEAITGARSAGLIIGFLGVVLLALPSLDAAGVDDEGVLAVAGMLAVVLAGVSYAVAAVYTRHRLTGHPVVAERDGSMRAPSALEIALGSAVCAFVVITALVLVFEPPPGGGLTLPETGTAWFAMLWLGALGTGLAYLLFFAIIERWGATRTTLVTYVIPVVAIALGYLLLGERLRPAELAGAALIIAGVVLVNAGIGRGWVRRKGAAAPD